MISIIIPTYNRPRELRLVLEGLRGQSGGPEIEVVVADDGSGAETRTLVDAMRAEYPHRLEHVWQEDRGFRAAAARNRAIERSSGEYLIFLDGDCVPLPGFVEAHEQARDPRLYLTGQRMRLDERRSAELDVERIAAGRHVGLAPVKERMRERVEEVRAGVHDRQGRKDRPKLLSCNASVDRAAVLAINGFDERFVGWGGEDDDFGRRLRREGILPKSVIGEARVLHLHHPPDPSFRGKVRLGDNYEYLHRGYFLTRCRQGIERRPLGDLRIRFLNPPPGFPAGPVDGVAEVEILFSAAPEVAHFRGDTEIRVAVVRGGAAPGVLRHPPHLLVQLDLPHPGGESGPALREQIIDVLETVL